MAREALNVPANKMALPTNTDMTPEGGDSWREVVRKVEANMAEAFASLPRAVDAAITVGAEAANVRAITVQVKDGAGENVAQATALRLYLTTTAARGTIVATGGSTGIAIGAKGDLTAVVAKKVFEAVTDATGALALTWTDTGTEAAFLQVVLPNGKIVTSAALANAA